MPGDVLVVVIVKLTPLNGFVAVALLERTVVKEPGAPLLSGATETVQVVPDLDILAQAMLAQVKLFEYDDPLIAP